MKKPSAQRICLVLSFWPKSPGRYNVIDGHQRITKARREGARSVAGHRLRCPEHVPFSLPQGRTKSTSRTGIPRSRKPRVAFAAYNRCGGGAGKNRTPFLDSKTSPRFVLPGEPLLLGGCGRGPL